MNNLLATETIGQPEAREHGETAPKKAVAAGLETWKSNERMRHVPTLEWVIWKVDSDVRERLAKLTSAFTQLAADDVRRAPIDAELKLVCRAVDRLSTATRVSRVESTPPPNASRPVESRIQWALDHAVGTLKGVDVATFGRRYPFHMYERSHAESIYGALLAVMSCVDRLLPLIREVDPGLDERLLDGLVVLQNPVDDRMLKPIAL
jgi:hypothetical protein